MHAARPLILVLLIGFATLGFGGAARATPQLLVDMRTAQVLFEQDAGVPWHPASLTKLMTAYVAFDAIRAGRVRLDTRVTLSQHAINQAPDKSGLPLGDSVSMQDALYIMLVKSANDMAVAIAETIDGSDQRYAEEMNTTAMRLGMTGTHYDNVNGLPDEGQVTTARDLAVLAIKIRSTFPQYDPIFSTQKVTIGKATLKTNNDLLTKFAGTTGMKTGFVCASGLNIVATVERGSQSLLAIVLGGSSARERNEMTAQMVLRGFSGEFGAGGGDVVGIANSTVPPMNMQPQICGKKARAYVALRQKAYPMGLKGKPSFLNDKLSGIIYEATDLGPAVSPSPSDALGDGTPAAESETGQPQALAEPVVTVEAPLPMPRLDRG